MNESSASDFQTAAHLYCTEADYDAAFPLMKKCAEGGHPSACFLLALMYRSGQGTTRDDEQYQYWLSRLLSIAEQGDPLAQWEVSCSFRWADHFPLDIELANYWLEKAAEGGHAEAQHLLGWSTNTACTTTRLIAPRRRTGISEPLGRGIRRRCIALRFENSRTDKLLRPPSPCSRGLLTRDSGRRPMCSACTRTDCRVHSPGHQSVARFARRRATISAAGLIFPAATSWSPSVRIFSSSSVPPVFSNDARPSDGRSTWLETGGMAKLRWASKAANIVLLVTTFRIDASGDGMGLHR
jgi:hypothetical protein